MRKHEEALEWAERTMRLPRINGDYPHAMLAAALGNLGRIDEARAAIAKALEWKADLTLSFARKNMPTKEPDGLDPYLEGLRRSGLPE
jgi:adenylate cyclase